MDSFERDKTPMGPVPYTRNGSTGRGFSTRTRSAPMSFQDKSVDSSEYKHNTGPERRASFIQRSGPLYANSNHEFVFQPPKVEKYPSSVDRMGKNEHLLRSGQLPVHYNVKPSRTSEIIYVKIQNMLRGIKNCAKRLYSFVLPFIPEVMNPHAKVVQQWNKLLIISCLFAVLLDPFFFFLLYVQENNNCVVLNRSITKTLIVLRSMNDFIYLLHILLQFRLAYAAPGNRVVGSEDLIADPKMIAWNYLYGLFIVDLFVVLPLSQIIVVLILRDPIGSGTDDAKNLVRLAILVQLVPRLHRILPLVVGSSPTIFNFESAWSNVVMNLLTFVLASHVVGSCWYLFGLQRVNRCLQDACLESSITRCMEFINCGHGKDYVRRFQNVSEWDAWKKNANAIACFGKDGFDFGIYQTAVNLTTHKSIATRYVYSLFWGFQQISTLAGNQVPSYFVWEVVFTMAITGVGLLLFALLIGNVQNFLQALGRRRVEMYVRRRDVEQWMSHHGLPEELRSKVRNSERFTNWATTSVVNERDLMENLPEDLQREIRRHLFKFGDKVGIFQMMDELIIDAIRERLKTKKYIQGSIILYRGGRVDKMVFISRGTMVSMGEDGFSSPLSEGDVCGEELFTWSLQHFSLNKDGKRIGIPGYRLLSNRVVSCLTSVEAFVLQAADLEEVMNLNARFLTSPRIQAAIRYESPYWRGLAARQIQIAWRYRKKRADSSSSTHN